MSIEIERRFLVASEAWREAATESREMVQGYLTTGASPVVRVRTSNAGSFLTIKGPRTGASAVELEYAIPREDADRLIELCGDRVVAKVRHLVPIGAHTWEVDVFSGLNEGLRIAEVEMTAEGEAVDLPEWLGEEITGQHEYANSSLATRPYSAWEATGGVHP